MTRLLSASQTVGPYFAIGLEPLCTDAVPVQGGDQQIVVAGRLLDADGLPIPDGFIEVWQADVDGRYAAGSPARSVAQSTGFARVAMNAEGAYRFATVKPAAVPYDAERLQAPHLVVLVYMRGLLRHLVTRMYFPDEPLNACDPVLQLVPGDRRETLIARHASGPGRLQWDIVMRDQAETQTKETVFFAW